MPYLSIKKQKRWFISLSIAIFLVGCNNHLRTVEEKKTEEYLALSEKAFQQAVKLLERQRLTGKNPQKAQLELARIYYQRQNYQKALEYLSGLEGKDAEKMRAISLYHLGDNTSAYEIFERMQEKDDQALFYFGLTCERLNLFEKAISLYKDITQTQFVHQAEQRLNIIERQYSPHQIEELDPVIAALIEQAPSQQDYPQAGALILLSDESIELTKDGRQITTVHYVIKILNERGKEDYAEMPTTYDSTFEKIKLEYARTIKPDGTVLEVGSRHIRDVTKYLNFPLYSNARVFIISFPEVAIGSTIEYKLRIERSQLLNKKDLVLAYPLQDTDPIIDARFKIILPKDRQLYMKILNNQYNDFGAQLSPNILEEQDKKIYSWQFKNIPQIIPEVGMPPTVEINPTILFSTFANWQEVYEWWWQLAKDKIKADTAIKSKVAELIADCVTAEDKARVIYNFCAKQIRYVAVEYGQAGHQPHTAEDIFKNKYGDCKDQAVLLVSMLKEAGLEAYLVLIATNDAYQMQEDFPCVLFDHAIAAVDIEGKLIFLDPTAETCSFGDLPTADQNRYVLIFTEKGYRIAKTELFSYERNLLLQSLYVTVRANEGINVQRRIETKGFYEQAQRWWLLYTLPEVVKEQLTTKAQEFSVGARLISYKIENLNDLDKQPVLTYFFEGPEFFIPAGNLRIMPQLADLDTSLVAKEKRRYPLKFLALDTRVIEVHCQLPEGFVIQYIPESIKEENPWLDVSISYTKNNNELIFRQVIRTKKQVVTQQEYNQFKTFVEQIATVSKQRVVLAKDEGKQSKK